MGILQYDTEQPMPPELKNNPKLREELKTLTACAQVNAMNSGAGRYKELLDEINSRGWDVEGIINILISYCPSYKEGNYPEVARFLAKNAPTKLKHVLITGGIVVAVVGLGVGAYFFFKD